MKRGIIFVILLSLSTVSVYATNSRGKQTKSAIATQKKSHKKATPKNRKKPAIRSKPTKKRPSPRVSTWIPPLPKGNMEVTETFFDHMCNTRLHSKKNKSLPGVDYNDVKNRAGNPVQRTVHNSYRGKVLAKGYDTDNQGFVIINGPVNFRKKNNIKTAPVRSKYIHLEKIPKTVQVGQVLPPGAKLGLVTKRASHLHVTSCISNSQGKCIAPFNPLSSVNWTKKPRPQNRYFNSQCRLVVKGRVKKPAHSVKTKRSRR